MFMAPTKSSGIPERAVIENVMHSVVQIVALRQRMLGNYSSAWTGSGTIVDPSGIILTNCHVANPRAMGMPAPQAVRLGVATTGRSDEPPALTYFAEIVAQSPELDLAVLRIVSETGGSAVTRLDLPHVPVGDSDDLELADTLSIFGYPGIGGETVTFTSGAVSGFSKQPGVKARRAWIKTDATIAGGNSGGTAVSQDGKLVGVPTQAAAGTGVTPVDARPVVDTTGDGRVDHRDTPMAIGGFINGLRPVNLAKPLLEQAGLKAGATAAPRRKTRPRKTSSTTKRAAPKPRKATARKTAGPKFSPLTFSSRVTRDGRPINPAEIVPPGTRQVFASFTFDGMRNGRKWGIVWAYNGKKIVSEEAKWEDGPRGRKVLTLGKKRGSLEQGEYHLAVTVGTQILAEGNVTVGRRARDRDTQVSGQLVDRFTSRGVANALIIALKPDVRVKDFLAKQSKSMAFTSTRSDRAGKFTFPEQLIKGQAYSLVVVAKGYRDLAVEGALRIGPQAPEHAQMNPIPMTRG
jgi:S1-C subfamily serine protease